MRVTLDVDEARKLAQENLNVIKQLREQRLNVHIEALQKRREWWRRFIPFLKPLSREDAIEALKTGDIFDVYTEIMRITYGRKEQICKDILKACRFNNDGKITLSEDDVYYLN